MSVDAPDRSGQASDEVLARLLASVDGAGEAAVGRLRGRRWADTAAVVVSNLSDYGYVWVAIAMWKGRRPGPARRRAVLALAGAGLTSYGVNKVAKQLVGRTRPQAAGPAATMEPRSGRLGVRRPTSSSFPSGHTLAAYCTALVLTDGPAQTAAALAFATAVAASRVHLRAHHASDVAGGAVIGTVSGLLVRRALARVGASEPRRQPSE